MGRRSKACCFAGDRRCCRTAQYLSFSQNRKHADACRRKIGTGADAERGAVATMKALPKSLWAATATPALTYPRLDGDAAADCVIVGGGFTGLSTALHSAAGGLKVVLIEANEPGWGASGRNGGQVIPGLKLDPSERRASYGEERGRRLTATVGATADLVFNLIDRHGIECNARRSGWIQGAPGPKGFAEVHNRAEEWAALGADVGVLNRDEVRARVGGGDYVGAFLDRRGGTINPLSYARGLARAAAAAGAQIYGGSPAGALKRAQQGWKVLTPAGSVTASHAVLCTNAYTDRLWPGLAETVVPVLSSVVATEPLSDNLSKVILPGREGVSETRRVLNWFGIDRDIRLIFGGRASQRETEDAQAFNPVLSRLKRLFPILGEPRIQFRWSGYVALTTDHVPHLHELAPNLYAGLGYNGRGVAMSTMMGKLLAERVAGAREHDIPLPATPIERIPFHGWRATGIALAIGWKRLQDRLNP
jgi:glycine/D-amino acid oxidase-like deaminating enzyme